MRKTPSNAMKVGAYVAVTLVVLMLIRIVVSQGPQPSTDSIREDDYIRTPLAAADQIYASIDGDRLKQWVEVLAGISRQSRDAGNAYWGRIAGTKYEVMTNDWVEARFRDFGLQDVRRQSFDLPPQWFPRTWEFSVTADGATKTLRSAVPALRSPSTPPAGLELSAVWVGFGSAADFVGRDVKGKAVFIHDVPSEAGNHSADWGGASKRAQDLGAAAIVLVYGTTDNWTVWERLGRDVELPGFVMGYQDGMAVRDLLGRGKTVTVRMKSSTNLAPGLKSASVWGVLPGTTQENIIVMAHQDGYFEAALDNASGVAVMMGLAEYFSKIPQEKRRRSLIFVGTAGHHSGSPNAQWMHDNRTQFLAKTALMINCEHASSTQTYKFRDQTVTANGMSALRWWIHGSPRLREIAFSAYRSFGIPTYIDMMQGSGEMGSVKLDAPSIQVLRSPEDKHSDNDTPEWVPAAGLAAVAGAYAKIIDGVNQLELKELTPPATTRSESR